MRINKTLPVLIITLFCASFIGCAESKTATTSMYRLMQQRTITLDPGSKDTYFYADLPGGGGGGNSVAPVYYTAWFSTGGWFQKRSDCLAVVKENTKRILSLERANRWRAKAGKSPIAGAELACIPSSPTK